jgi:hypothetical protein
MCDLILFWWENIDHWSGSSYRIYHLYNSFPLLPGSGVGGGGAGQEIGAEPINSHYSFYLCGKMANQTHRCVN